MPIFIRRNLQASLFALTVTLAATGCAKLPKTVPVHGVSTANFPAANNGSNGAVLVGNFVDSRPVGKTAPGGMTLVGADGDTGPTLVASAVGDILRKQGILVGGETARSLTGEVQVWEVQIDKSITGAKLLGHAGIAVIVRNEKDGRTLYAAHYSGQRYTRDIYPREARISQVLSQAMSLAVAEMGRDEKLLAVLRER